METAVRWSTHSTPDDRRFLHVDVTGRKLRSCRITSLDSTDLKYEVTATHSRVPVFRAFDWSLADPALVAVGQSSGETTVLRIDDGSEAAISFPIRSQRLCNAVAFNTQGLLAAGLDKVRNDFCLNIWDLNQRVPTLAGSGGHGFSGDKGHVDPYAKLASSEPITSIKFFEDQPQVLVAGVKAQFVRIYDLREQPGHTALQFATRCVHNLSIDPCDSHIFASCIPSNDPTVCIWDRRAGARSQSTLSFGSDSGQAGPALELKNIADAQSTIWSLRFARSRRGCLGMLTSTGQFKTFDIGKEYLTEQDHGTGDDTWTEGWRHNYPEDIFVEGVQEVERAYHTVRATRRENNRIVTFDFMTHDEHLGAPGAITIAANGEVKILATGRVARSSSFYPFIPTVKDASYRLPGIRESKVLTPSAALSNGTHDGVIPQTRLLHLKHSLNPMRLFRERCEKGYQFDPAKNRSLLAKGTSLMNFWQDVERAAQICQTQSLTDIHLDLSYLGVYSIWTDDLGIPSPYTARRVKPSSRPPPSPAKTIETLAKTLELPPLIPAPQTTYPAHRQLCLYLTGIQMSPAEVEKAVKKATKHNESTKGAAIALFASQPKLAIRALRGKSSTEVHKMLAMAIASSLSRQRRTQLHGSSGSEDGDDSDTEWNEILTSLLSSVPPATEDPWAHAIISTIMHGTPAHSSILSNPELPIPVTHKLYVALHHLSDPVLSTYISSLTQHHVRTGSLPGITLTGLATPKTFDLFANYISNTGDVQTAVLALTPVIPRYLSSPSIVRLFESWRADYRAQMQIWDLKFQRVKFDVTGRKLAVSRTGTPLIPPARPQISLTCTYCQQSVEQVPAPAKPGFPASTTEDGNSGPPTSLEAGNSTGKSTPVHTTITKTSTPRSHPLAFTKAAAIGTICPKCGRGLPRCGICELPLGMPDSTYLKPITISEKKTGKKGTNTDSLQPPPSAQEKTGGNSLKRGSIVSGTSATATAADPKAAGPSPSAPPPPDSANPSAQPQTQREQQEPSPSPSPPSFDTVMSKFITFCVSCGHAFHAVHAREWFGSSSSSGSNSGGGSSSSSISEGHRICPVPGCGCLCDRRAVSG